MKQYNLREILRKNVILKNLKEVESLLDHYPHLLSEHKNKFNLINIAVQNNDVKLMKLLASYNIDPNIKYKGLSSLHLAVQKQTDLEIIKSLIVLSADLDSCDKYGNTPLHYAAKIGNTQIIQELINAGTNIDYMNKVYASPIDIARKYKNSEIVDLLIKAGAKRKRPFLDTAKLAYTTANIYRKATIIVFTGVLLTINTTASILTYGVLFPTIVISILASIGISIVCLAKPFFRVKSLEKKIMNKQINHNELKELFTQPANTETSASIPATNLVPDAINDNFFLIQHKNNLEKVEVSKQEAVK